MDLMTLAAKIDLDSKDFESGVRNAEGMGQRLGGKLNAMTVAAGQLIADITKKSFNAVKDLVGGAIDSYADYEQLVGGVETLFKNSAGKVQKYAAQSYKTTGLSANKYMETVTSFSASLLQGLEGDTDQAAEYANIAIVDMADNANKLGTDMGTIQSAYQAFAKQNWTLLDNLKLGYGGTEKEMVRLINDSGILSHEIESMDGITFDQIILAIHEIQTEMGIAGATAQEAASTISGSKASLKAAWEDLLAAVGGAGGEDQLNQSLENFKDSFSTYMTNLVPTLVDTIANSGDLVVGIADAIAALPTTLLSDLGDAGLEAGTEMVGGLSKITSWLIDSITNMFTSATADPSQLADLGTAIGEFLGTAIADIITKAPAILEGAINVGIALAGGLIEGLFKGLFGEGAEVDKITKALEDDLTDIDLENNQATGILRYMDKLYEKFGDGVTKTAEWKTAQEELEKVLPGAGKVFEDYGNDIGGAMKNLERLNEEMRKNAIISGFEKALREERELLGEQQATAEMARTRADMAREKKAAAAEGMNDTAIAAAKEILRLQAEGENLYMGDREGQILANAQKTLETGESDKISELIDVLEGYYDQNDIEGAGTIWGKSETDTIFDQETIDGLEASIKGYENTIKENEKIAKDAEEQAAATQKEINVTMAALNRTLAEDESNFEHLGGSTGGAADALDKFAQRVAGIHIGLDGTVYMPRAVGMDYVPFDGFKAELHKGERIVPAAENKRGGDGTVSGDLEGRIERAIRAGMQDVTVNTYLDGQKITDDVNRRNINAVKGRRYAG